MAMNVSRDPAGAMADINVTPMADVMIVLLIIFMVTVPVLTRPVALPRAAHLSRSTEGPPVLVVDRSGLVRAGGQLRTDPNDIRRWLEEELGRTGVTAVLVQADREAPYSAVAAVFDACREAGVEQVGLAAEREVRQ
jgi:biopolymer transport protein ExbD